MKNKKILLISCLLMIFISMGVVFASDTNSTSLNIGSDYDNLDSDDYLASTLQEDILDAKTSDDIPTIDSDTVSGGVDVVAVHPWSNSDEKNGNHGDLVYTIPSKATDIKCAYVYVTIYSGSAQTNYGSVADISIKTDNGYLNKTEDLWISSGTTDGENYIVNDHITKCYSDYMIFYNITEMVQGLSGRPIEINVASLPMNGKSFDGRIKLISLILAYDDGDSDRIDYWINAGQAWTDEKTYTSFNSGDADIDSNTKITLTNIGLSSNDAFYEINGESLFGEEGDEYISGDYYQYHKWDITDYFVGDTEMAFTSSKDGWASFKEVLSVLIINHNYSEDADANNKTSVDFKTEYSTGTNPTVCIFAGTNNTIAVNAITNNKGTYRVELLVDGTIVDKKDVTLLKNVAKTIYLTDPAIREVNQKTVSGENNAKVTYTVRILLNDEIINSTSHVIPVLYNGYLGKDLAYPMENYEQFSKTITGDIVINTKEESSYLERKDLQRTDVWNVQLPNDSNFVNAYIYVPYNYFIPDYSKKIPEDINMFSVKFNDASTLPVGFYRDQSNLGNYAKYGYGLLVYDVTDLIKNGENTFILNKKDEYPAVHPSTLIYLYNTTGSSEVKEVYISNGVDLLENSYNLANRTVKSDLTVNLNSNLVKDATLYVFAAGAQKGEGDIVFNGVPHSNVWDGTLYETDYYKLDITKYIDEINNISFISTGSTIQALQQIIVLNKNLQTTISEISTEYEDNIFAGIKNDIKINIDNTRSGKFTVELLADGKSVSSKEIELKGNSLSLMLTDSTIRSATKNSVYGSANDKVKYTVNILDNNNKISSFSKDIPILYNGYLGKDLQYPSQGYELFFKGTITGDIVIYAKDNYLSIPTLKRSDVWNVNLPKNSNFVKAFIYVPYYFFDNTLGITEGNSMFTTSFNGKNIAPVGFYRDQANYGVYAKNGYGLLVYDVTDLIKNGDNTFDLNKNKATTTVCPSTLIYLYNTTTSTFSKNVYISNGADLLSSDKINSLTQVKSSSFINVDLNNADDAKLYVFAAGAQKDESNIVFNGKEFTNVWNGKTFTSEMYSLNIKDNLKANNTISYVSTGSEILALQQILVTSSNKVNTIISVGELNIAYGNNLVLTLKDAKGNVLSDKHVSIKINDETFDKTTDANGQAKLPITLSPGEYSASFTFSGDGNYAKSTGSVKFTVEKASPLITATKKNFEPTAKTKKYSITLKDNRGVMKNTKVSMKVNGKTYTATTNSNGVATFNLNKLTKKGTYKDAVITYNGNENYNKVTKKVTITVKPTPKLTAKQATFKVKTKTKTYSVTLKDNKNKVMKNTKVTINVNGKTYSAKTNSKGIATFKITKLTKKGVFTSKVSFAGNTNYNSVSKSVKITVK